MNRALAFWGVIQTSKESHKFKMRELINFHKQQKKLKILVGKKRELKGKKENFKIMTLIARL